MFACSAEVHFIKGHVPRIVAGLAPVRELDPTRRLDLAIGLPLRNREALTNLLQDLYDPASSNYHQYLSPQEFTDRFGPDKADYQAVVNFARSNHLVVTGTHANRMLLDVNAQVRDVERAFHLKLNVYQHPSEPRTFYSPAAEPLVDARLPVLSIAGLDDFYLARPMDLRSQLNARLSDLHRRGTAAGSGSAPQPALNATGSGPSGTFLGLDFRAAYAPGIHLDGSGEAVGLVELDNYYPGDITAYEQLAGLPQVVLTNVFVDGFNRPPGLNNGEVALDIEMAIAMAPGLSRVIVYEGTVGNDVLNRMATDNLARQLSCSWSFGHPIDATREQIFQQFAAQGQSFFQASGDGGAYGSSGYPPADDPFVTSVGGASLSTVSPRGAWSSETAWSGSGGGISGNYPIPVWQQAINMAANQGSQTMRNVPDVAAMAEANIWTIANNGEQGTVGGTSAAAPLWAGFAALVNQRAAAEHLPAIGFANPAIYAIGQGPGYSMAFHDIVSGNNTNAGNPARFFATTGYDLCTGWGTPNGTNLVNALLSPSDALRISPATPLNFTGPVGGPFTSVGSRYFATNAGTGPLCWTVGTTSVWLNVSPSSGTSAPGEAPAAINIAVNSLANSFVPGTYSADLSFTNLSNGFSQRRGITLEVAAVPLITGQPLSQMLPTGAPASFVVETATNATLSYQWRLNGTNLTDSGKIGGSSTAMLTISNATRADNGPYSVAVSNVVGSTVSSNALLTITSSPPVIALQPATQTVSPGAPVSLSVVAYGDSLLTYQWRKNGTNLTDRPNLSGTASALLQIRADSSNDAGSYSVVVSNAFGARASAEAQLSVVSLTSADVLQTSVHLFSGGLDGGHPNDLARGRDGKIYGTAQTGGAAGAGTIFELDSGGQPTPIYSFTGGTDGGRPNGGLLQDSRSTLLGTTYGGGSNGFGTIFQVTSNGLITLFAFNHTNGVLPAAGLTQLPNGDLYGTAYEGGILHYGALFRLASNGTYTTLFPFDSTNGAFPHAGLVLGTDGNFYGTTFKGGLDGYGTVFRLSPAGAVTTLAAFSGTNGAFPLAGLVQADDGSFFGTTTSGGAFGFGTIYRVTRAGLLSSLVSFTGGVDGSYPQASLIQATDGNFYGSTAQGGAFGLGTIFRMSPDGALSTLAHFDGYNGANPQAPLLESADASLYGTTQNGGPDDQGAIFQLSIPSAAPQITSQPTSVITYAGADVALRVATFGAPPLYYQWLENGTNLIDAGNISGAGARILTLSNVTSANAGSYSVIVSNKFGSIVSSQAVFQVLSSAPVIVQQPTNQTWPPGSTAVLSAAVVGNLPLTYQWQRDGTNTGDSGNVTGATTDTLIITSATERNNGTYVLSVTNALGGISSAAAVVTIVPVSATGTRLATLYWFNGGSDGGNPSELAQGRDGFYGTTEFGGDSRSGAVFKVGTNGTLTTVASFDRTNGAMPLAGLVVSTNNHLYGTASGGGAYGFGTLFALNDAGVLTTLYSFAGGLDGATPDTALFEQPDGSFWGSSIDSGANGLGTLFESSPLGALSTVHSFTGGVDGFSPTGALAGAPDGKLYGMTTSGGTFGKGAVFAVSPTAPLTNLYSFSGGADGATPVGSLALGDDGALYGATRYNTIRGFSFYGTFFRLSTEGEFSTLYVLNFTDGSYPAAGLILGSDGNFYGTTEQGGANGYGTLFRMTPAGLLSTLVEFDGFNDGAKPVRALTQGSDGSLYGTTSTGGLGFGTIFRLDFTGPPQLTGQPANQIAFEGDNSSFGVAVTGAPSLAYQWQRNGTNLSDIANIRGANSRVLRLLNVSLADAGAYSVVVTNAVGSVSSASASLVVRVQATPPALQAFAPGDGTLNLTWTAVAGRTYQIQAKPSLVSGNWTNTGVPIIATNAIAATSLTMNPPGQQFYRLVLLP